MNDPHVRLRDITLADADLLEAWDTPAIRGEFNDFGLPPSPAPREAMAKGPLRNDHNGQLIVELVADGTPIGTVGWHQVVNGPVESIAWNIGITLIPEARGHGYGTEAQRLLAAYLFETTGVNRVEASTDVANGAEQRSLEKAGFRREGIMRGAQFRAGAYHDLVLYSRLRDDPA
ncbi:MAG: GNAT family N-acetyltransferase [Chloroflexota bacterium]|nr:GNAT family N-acetyltransferase [Chloroflexota bacterium]